MAILDLDISEIFSADLEGVRFVHLRHPGESNLIRLSRRDEALKEALVHLAARGFLVYKYENAGVAVTSFVHASVAPAFWARNNHNGLLEHQGICYRLGLPAGGVARRLLVVFSCISPYEQMYDASLSTRIFCLNFPQAPKYVPWDTAILRIADLGGVVGAFYADTIAQPDNESRVSALITKVAADLGVERQHVVLYGASKGGTGALLHSLNTGFKAVCVDPILADDYYVRRFRDSHFTQGVFPQDKRELFTMRLSAPAPDADRAVICSTRSPQYPYIDEIAQRSPAGDHIAFLDVQSPAIHDHPDVCNETLGIQVHLINQMLYGIPLQGDQLESIRASSQA